jgi:hypothetical protein
VRPNVQRKLRRRTTVVAEDLAKAGDTIAALLTHPDPIERALALTLAHVEPKHISIAEKDPHPRVQAAVARWKLKHLPPERVDGGFTATHGQVNDRHGPTRIMYFHASPEQSAALGIHGHGVTQYSRKLFQHLGHFAPDILGYVRYTGDPEAGKVVAHEIHAPWYLSPAMRGVHVGSWLNHTFDTDHDLGQIEGEGQSMLSDLAHHGVEHKLFGGQDPERVLHDSFVQHVQSKGAKQVEYHSRPYEHPESLRKDIGYVTFPKMGVSQVPTQVPVVQPESQAHYRNVAQRMFPQLRGVRPNMRHYDIRDRMFNEKWGAGYLSNNESVRDETSGPKTYMRGYVVAPVKGAVKTVHGIGNHEAQHSVFAAVGQQFGHRFRERVAEHLIGKLSKDEQETLNKMMEVSGYDTYQHPEEGITCHQNYLTDPKWREHVHSTLALDSIRARHMHNTLKRTWKKLRAHAALLTPAEIIG